MARKILFTTDGSEYALNALKRWLAEHPLEASSELHLLNVQLPVDGNVRSFVNADAISDYHREERLNALSPGGGNGLRYADLGTNLFHRCTGFSLAQCRDCLLLRELLSASWRTPF
jgi:hypothetical protein